MDRGVHAHVYTDTQIHPPTHSQMHTHMHTSVHMSTSTSPKHLYPPPSPTYADPHCACMYTYTHGRMCPYLHTFVNMHTCAKYMQRET